MSATAQKFATYEDLFDLPGHIIGEIIHGQLVTQPRPTSKHAVARSAIGDELVSPFQNQKGR